MEQTPRNGFVRWPQFIGTSVSLLVLIVGATGWGINHVVANDRLREMSDKEIRICVEQNLRDINASLFGIERRLAKIETKIEYYYEKEKER